MSTEIAASLPSALPAPSLSAPATAARRPAQTRAEAAGMRPSTLALMALLALLAALAWYVREYQPYTSASDLGYWMGVAGGSLMAALLLYPLRKRMRWTQLFGPLRHWFRFHMVAGIGGPLLVLYHSTFHVGSFNAAIALASMLLVAASGIVGRFLYRRIHHGLYGREATLKELQEGLEQQLASLGGELADLPAVKAVVESYLRHIAKRPPGRLAALGHFLGLGHARRAANRHAKRLLPQQPQTRRAIAETLAAAQRAGQFNAYVRLFALWHVIHIPFLGMLVLTAIAHVVAVHTY